MSNIKYGKLPSLGIGTERTGDIARFQSEKIYIVDRKKEMIKVRGWQVGPAELEGVLLKHEHIAGKLKGLTRFSDHPLSVKG